MQLELAITLISAGSVLLGVILGIVGQWTSNYLEYKRRIQFLISETFFRNRLIYLEKITNEVENAFERSTQILYVINAFGKEIKTDSVHYGKLTKSAAREIINRVLKRMNEKRFEDIRPAGKSVYFSDGSPFINKLNVFITENVTLMVVAKRFATENLKNLQMCDALSKGLQQNLKNAADLLNEIRAEMLR